MNKRAIYLVKKWALVNYLRMRAIWIILSYRRFAGLGLPSKPAKDGKFHQANANNMSGQIIFLVPHDATHIAKAIKILENTHKELVHKSQHHSGLSITKKPTQS